MNMKGEQLESRQQETFKKQFEDHTAIEHRLEKYLQQVKKKH